MVTEVIIPWAGGCVHRQRALDFVVDWHSEPVTVAEIDGEWSKGRAVNPAIRASSAGIIVVADADVISEGLSAAIKDVEDGAGWAIPHHTVIRLAEESTTRFIETGEVAHPLDRRQYRGMAGGGFVVARRETLLDIPLDPRFVGWGQEDDSWSLALTCLKGQPWRGDADLVHLWHPPQPKVSRRRGSPESWELFKRYREAKLNPKAMRNLIQEIHALEPH